VVEAGALLHDVDKLPAAGALVQRLPHGEGSAAWVAERGAPELAEVIRSHPVTLLADDPAADRILTSPLEIRIVAYADKRAGQRLESMDARFRSWQRRYPDGWEPALRVRVRDRAQALERRLLDELGVASRDVRRLPWVRRAMAAA
jgi:hypothetical protein